MFQREWEGFKSTNVDTAGESGIIGVETLERRGLAWIREIPDLHPGTTGGSCTGDQLIRLGINLRIGVLSREIGGGHVNSAGEG